MKIYKKAVLPKGFKANGFACGLKKSKKLDLALIYSEIPAGAACVFTSNKLVAAPIKLNQKHLKANKFYRAILINSGNANCFTGNQGQKDACQTAKSLALALTIGKEETLVASTGIIGKRLNIEKIRDAIPQLIKGLSSNGINKAKLAIMTTDTFAKEVTVKFNIGSQVVTICGIAKGAGMIAPNMATMLAFILTDANVKIGALNKALKVCVDTSFNCITVDGCMSTNDSVMLLANGASRSKLIGNNADLDKFVKALKIVCQSLAKMIVSDAEGATKFIEIKVKKAKDFHEARKLALAIANSNLFKTAMYGQNPNFGRIVAAVGACGIDVKEKDLKIKVSPLNKDNINIGVSVNRGNASAIVYTSDLTPEYIKINAEYN